MIDVRDLVFEYPTKRALHGVSLTIPAGSITALVGPNGAGKTTLLRCMAALDRPYTGRVSIDGIDTQENPRAIHARLGYLPDFFGLYDDLTVARCLFYAARARGLPAQAAEEAAQTAAARVQLSDRMEARSAELSRGLRQRLAIGQAIVHDPKVLLLDEPASGLDPQARRELSQLLLDLRARGMTLVVSSHILSELEDYSTDMVVVNDGRIAGGGPIAIAGRNGTTLRVVLARSDVRFGAFLKIQPGVRVLRADDATATVAVDGGPFAQALLLRSLMAEGFAVSEFAEAKASLEDAYFAEVGHVRER